MTPEITIGQALKLDRLRRRLTQNQAAQELGISRSYYAKLESTATNPRLRTIWPFLQRACRVESLAHCDSSDSHYHVTSAAK
jgi:transcriptional regulator with XRE-family HTH domain